MDSIERSNSLRENTKSVDEQKTLEALSIVDSKTDPEDTIKLLEKVGQDARFFGKESVSSEIKEMVKSIVTNHLALEANDAVVIMKGVHGYIRDMVRILNVLDRIGLEETIIDVENTVLESFDVYSESEKNIGVTIFIFDRFAEKDRTISEQHKKYFAPFLEKYGEEEEDGHEATPTEVVKGVSVIPLTPLQELEFYKTEEKITGYLFEQNMFSKTQEKIYERGLQQKRILLQAELVYLSNDAISVKTYAENMRKLYLLNTFVEEFGSQEEKNIRDKIYLDMKTYMKENEEEFYTMLTRATDESQEARNGKEKKLTQIATSLQDYINIHNEEMHTGGDFLNVLDRTVEVVDDRVLLREEGSETKNIVIKIDETDGTICRVNEEGSAGKDIYIFPNNVLDLIKSGDIRESIKHEQEMARIAREENMGSLESYDLPSSFRYVSMMSEFDDTVKTTLSSQQLLQTRLEKQYNLTGSEAHETDDVMKVFESEILPAYERGERNFFLDIYEHGGPEGLGGMMSVESDVFIRFLHEKMPHARVVLHTVACFGGGLVDAYKEFKTKFPYSNVQLDIFTENPSTMPTKVAQYKKTEGIPQQDRGNGYGTDFTNQLYRNLYQGKKRGEAVIESNKFCEKMGVGDPEIILTDRDTFKYITDAKPKKLHGADHSRDA